MTRIRQIFRRSRWSIVLVLLSTFSYSVEANNFALSYRVAADEEARLEEMAKRLGVPVEKLRREQPGLVEALRGAFTNAEEQARQAGLARVEAQLRTMSGQVAANPYRAQIDEVKNAYQGHRLDGLLRDLTQLGTTEVLALPVASRKALLKNVRKALEEDLEPHVPEGLPGKARGRQDQLRGRLKPLYAKLRKILDEPDAISDAKLAQTLGKLAAEVNQEVRRTERGPRFKDRPLPLQLREQTVPTQEVTQPVGAPSSAMVSAPAPSAVRRLAAAALPPIPPEIAALAQSLGGSPARIFAHVHDNVRYDPKWGAVRSPLGTLQEGEGTSWDQAWLLQELLAAAGVDARVEWGQVEIPTSLLLTLTGTSDPFDAGNLISTGGVPAVLLVQGGKVVGARIGHVWVKAHLDYVPNRGVTQGTADTWVRMDPTLKRYGFAEGIDVHSQVPFDLGAYLQTGTELSPRRAYEDALFAYIRANNIDCANLEQLKKAAQVVRERFPFVPGTLRGKILRVDGEQAAVPEAFQQRLTLEVKTAAGASLLSWSTPAPAVYGKRVEIDYLGATSEDQATLDAYGGVFETPPYLVDLKPVVKVAGASVAQGGAVGSAAGTEVWVTMTAPTGPPTIVTHVTSAGERHVLAADFGEIPQAVLDAHQAALSAALAAGNSSEAEAEILFLVGAQYLHNLGRDLTDLSGWKWQRLVRLGTEGLITQTGVVTTTVGGAPISFRRGQRNVDIALMPLGMVPADGRRQFRREAFELLGAQSSFLEGEVFNQVLQREGIASVSALTLAKRQGQTLSRVDGANVDAILAQADLGADAEAEIRAGVARGRIAWVAQSRIAVQQWRGTGYVLEDPATGAAAYLISGGFAGGDETGADLDKAQDLLGSEPWLEGGLLSELFRLLDSLIDGGGDRGPSTQKSDPINLSTGNLWRTEKDLSVLARGIALVWSRTYNSRSSYSGPLGFGWTFAFGERLEERADGTVLYLEDDGTEHVFIRNADATYASPPGKHLTLAKGATEFSLQTRHGLVSRFALDGRLLSLGDTNGNTVTLDYDTAGNLENVIDGAGRTALTVSTQNGKITQVADLAGRSVSYAYQGDDLIEVTDTLNQRWSYTYDEDHNLIALADPLANTDSYSYDSLDRCFRHVDPLGNTEIFSYARIGERGVLTDRRGFDVYVEFDERGRATLEADALGNTSRSTWDGDNNRTSTEDPRGGTTLRTFDDRGNLLSERDPLDKVTSFTYDPVLNRLLTITDPANHTITSSYDARGNLIETRQVVANQAIGETYGYDGFGQMVERKDPNGNATTYSWHAVKGVPESQTDAAGHTTTVTTDALGRITEILDPGNNRVILTWDGKDRLASAKDPYGNTVSFTYDAADRRTAVTNPRGTARSEYDAAGRMVRAIDVLGNVISSEHDAAGNVVAWIDARNNRTTVSYDPIGRPAAMVDALGAVWTYGYCAQIGSGGAADICEVTDPLGNTTRQDFDELGRVRQMTDPLGNRTSMEFDALGRRSTLTDALGHLTRYEYDELGRLRAVIEPDLARTEYSYDKSGNLINVKDAEGRNWPRTYDELNRLKTESDPLGNTTTYTYDLIGNLKTKLTAKGDLITFEHEVRRLAAVVLPGNVRETFGYDALGRRTSMANGEVSLDYVYDELNRLTEVTDNTLGLTISYEYDANGNRTKMTGPRGPVTYHYDARNRLVEQRDPAAGIVRFAYDSIDRRTELRHPNGLTTSYDYDAASRLLSVVARDGQSSVIDGYSYSYDAVGNRSQMTALREGSTRSFSYDENYRLTRWQAGAGRFEEYFYDRVGNRKRLTDEGGETDYVYDDADRLLSLERTSTGSPASLTAFTWDDNGALTSKSVGALVTTFQWDALGRLTQMSDAGGLRSYGYTPEGIRVRETEGGTTRRSLLSGEDVIAVYGQGGGLETYFSHGPGIDEPLAQVSGSDVAYLHRDGLGSVTALSSPAGQLSGSRSYGAFGDVEVSSGVESRYGFTSREQDATGLSYYRSRYYQPESGRFLSRDAFAGFAELPASLHDYAYAHNNPVNRVDPFGNFAGKEDMYRVAFNFMLLYGLAITVVGVGVDQLTGDDGFLRYGLELYQHLLSVAIIITLVERYGAAVWARARLLVAGVIASLQELPRTGHVTNPIGKTAIVTIYVIIRLVIAAGKNFAGSGASYVVAARNIADFWRTGNIAELMKGPNPTMM